MIDDCNLELVSKMLYQSFFYNSEVFALQQFDANKIVYKTKYERIDATKIKYYLKKNISIMAYQQKFANLKWICLDFDVSSKVIPSDYNFINDEEYRPKLFEEVEKCCKLLDDNNISYLKEYSGNRGIHVWIIFEHPITKQLGYTIIENIIEKSDFKYINKDSISIGLDRFPATSNPKNNKIGKGVKIPLSFHLKSNSLSYLIDNLDDIVLVNNLSDELLEKQISILSNYKFNDISSVIKTLKITEYKENKEFLSIKSVTSSVESEQKILDNLKKSILYEELLNNLHALNESERRILVGTFIRLKTKNDKEFGLKLLKNIFSKMPNYDEELTETKLKLLKNLYPPNISFIEKTLGMTCNYCKDNKIKNAIDLIEGVTIVERNLDVDLFYWTKYSEKNYLLYNDEVPLTFIEDELKTIKFDAFKKDIDEILINGKFPVPIKYKYERKEDSNKIRTLYSLSGRDRILSTYIMKYLYDIIGQNNISDISYSYRINTNSSNNIFVNWNSLWLEFVKKIQSFTLHEAYDDYYVIKLDIKSFYDSINLIYLKEILLKSKDNNFDIEFIKENSPRFDELKKREYIHAINYLLYINEKVLDSKIGVPQGPAYARFLAEIYLASFDEFLKKQLDPIYDYAYRYVDDYFIFIKDQSKGEQLKKILLNKLLEMSLSTNDKVKFGILKDIKEEIEIFNQIEKYFIDSIDENTPELVKIEGLKILNNMYTNFIDNGDTKDFPFFLTHLWSDTYLKDRADVIIDKVKKIEIGRGSFFKHFYNKVAIKYSNLEMYSNVKGLSRSNLLTSLMRNNSTFSDYENLFRTYISIEDLSIYEKKELYRLVLSKGININGFQVTDEDYKIIVDLILNIPDKKNIIWTENLFITILDKIQNEDDKVYAINLLDRILLKSNEIINTNYYCELIFSIINLNEFGNINSKDTLQSFYNLVSYSTLFIPELAKINALWNKLLSFNLDSINQSKFFAFLSNKNLSNINIKNIFVILIQLFKEESFIRGNKATNLEYEFAYYLFLELYNSDKAFFQNIIDNYSGKMKELKIQIEKLATEKNAMALLWSLDDRTDFLLENVQTYKNMEINNRLILKKDNEILIRGPKEIFDNSSYTLENMVGDKNYAYKIINFGINTLTDYQTMIKNKGFIDIISYSHRVLLLIKDTPVNIFERGTLIQEDLIINFSFSKNDKKFLVDFTEIPATNDAIILKMIDFISQIDWNHIFDNTDYELNNKVFKSIIVPKFIKKNKDATVMYFKEFCYLLDTTVNDKRFTKMTLFKLEEIKILSLKKCLTILANDVDKDMRNLSNSFKLLSLYNKFYSSDEYSILYNKINLPIDNLYNRLEFFKESISNNLKIKFTEKLISDLDKLINIFEEENGSLKHYIRLDEEKVNNLKQSSTNLYYTIFDGEFAGIEMTDDIFTLNKWSDAYYFDGLIVFLPKDFSLAKQKAERKNNKYDKIYVEKAKRIKSNTYFSKSVDKIVAQSNISSEDAESRIINFLLDKDEQYYDSVLLVISSYKEFSESNYEEFIEKLKLFLYNNQNIATIPLKDFKSDENGLKKLLDRYPEYFDRKQHYRKKIDQNIKDLERGNIKKDFVLFSDIGISCSQFKRSLNYYLQDKKDTAEKSNKYFEFNSENIIKSINDSENIYILNCVYTDVYEENVKLFFEEDLEINPDKLIFLGEKINVEDTEYSLLKIHELKRKKFVEFVKKYFEGKYNSNIHRCINQNYGEYLEESLNKVPKEKKVKYLLLLRTQSMPKLHHRIFDNEIFNYRKD